MTTKFEVPIDTPITTGIKKFSLVWPVAAAFVTMIFILGRMSMQQDILIRDFRSLTVSVQAHLDSDGHKVALLRTDNLIRDMGNLQRQVDELRGNRKTP